MQTVSATDSCQTGSRGSRHVRWQLRVLEVNEAISRLGLFLEPRPTEPLRGELRGPYCEFCRTLPARYGWRRAPVRPDSDQEDYVAEVVEACLWEPARPFLYDASWEAEGVASRVRVGWRALALTGGSLRLNGRPFWFRGLVARGAPKVPLPQWGEQECNLLDLGPSPPLETTNRLGPFVVTELPTDLEAAQQAIAAAGPVHPSIGIWLIHRDWPAESIARLHRQDPTTLFGLRVAADEVFAPPAVDLLLVRGRAEEVTVRGEQSGRSWIAQVEMGQPLDARDAAACREVSARLDGSFRSRRGCVGWLVPGALGTDGGS